MTVAYMQKFGRRYPDCGFGAMFSEWVFSDAPEPYNSFGKGAGSGRAAMPTLATGMIFWPFGASMPRIDTVM